jgi:hypothetical protein
VPTAWDNLPDTNTNTNTNKRPKIAIVVPYITDWNPEWVTKTRDPLEFVPLSWGDKIIFKSKAPSLPVARTSLVEEALKVNADYIFFVDTDIIFESPTDPNVALSMLYQCMDKNKESRNGKMVSGLYRAKQQVGFNYAGWMKVSDTKIKGYIPIQSWSGNWIVVDVAGLGCTLIDTKVFRELEQPWFYWESSGGPSEDFYFFEFAKKHGYNLHLFTEVKATHGGYMKVKCDGTVVLQEM